MTRCLKSTETTLGEGEENVQSTCTFIEIRLYNYDSICWSNSPPTTILTFMQMSILQTGDEGGARTFILDIYIYIGS